MDRELLQRSAVSARRVVLSEVASRLRTSGDEFAEYRDRPLEFMSEVLGHEHWGDGTRLGGNGPGTAGVVRSVWANKQTTVPAGHGTGKTFSAGDIAVTFLVTYPNSQVLTTAPTAFHVEKRLWAEINRTYHTSRRRLPGQIFKTKYELGPKRFAVGISTNNPDNFQGGHEEYFLIIFDEAQGVAPEIWAAGVGMMTNPGARWLNIGNPTYSAGEFYDTSLSPEWHTIHLDCEDHPNILAALRGEAPPIPAAVSLAWVREREREWTRDSPLFQSRVKGIFPRDSEDILITRPLLEEAADAVPSDWGHDLPSSTYLGVDPARYGPDFTSWCVTRNGVPIFTQKRNGLNTVSVAGETRRVMREFNVEPDHVNVDAIGIGAGVVDTLHNVGVNVVPIEASGKPTRHWREHFGGIKVHNYRAQLWWAARCLLQKGELSIPRKYKEIWRDLTTPRYKFSEHDKVVVESKEKIRDRLKRSPDVGDAFILTLARDPRPVPNLSFF